MHATFPACPYTGSQPENIQQIAGGAGRGWAAWASAHPGKNYGGHCPPWACKPSAHCEHLQGGHCPPWLETSVSIKCYNVSSHETINLQN